MAAGEKVGGAKFPKRRRWPRVFIAFFVLLAILIVGCNTCSSQLARRYDARQPRDPDTGVLRGAEACELGPVDAVGAVLFVHGFLGSGDHFGALPEQVAEAGWRAVVMRLPGHGSSPRDLREVTADDLVEAVADETQRLLQSHDQVVLLGHSMGGALVTLVAAQEPVDGLILAAPYFSLTHRWYYGLHPETWARLLSPFLRWVYRPVSMDPVADPSLRGETVDYRWFPGNAVFFAVDLKERAKAAETLGAITAPVLLLHGIHDRTTSPEAAQAAVEGMASEAKAFVSLPRSDHLLFRDYDHAMAEEAVLGFLEEIGDTD